MRIYLLLLALLPTLVYAQVDMGLPSGLKWMHYNVDAKNETDRGLYFSWGALKRTKPRGDPYMDEDDYANSCANTHPFRGGMIAGCQS